MTRAGFKIALERLCLGPIRKSHIGDETPGFEFGGMLGFTCIVVSKPLLEVRCQANVAMRGTLGTFNQIDRVQDESPSSLKLRRASCFDPMIAANPAKRGSAKQDGGAGR